MPLAKADTSKTERFNDGADWLVLRTELTKGDTDAVQDLNSHYKLPPELFGAGPQNGTTVDAAIEVATNAREINRTLFDLLAVEWSLGEKKPTARDYDELTAVAGEWVDECVTKAIAIGRGRAEGNRRSSRKPRNSRTSSEPASRSKQTASPPRSGD